MQQRIEKWQRWINTICKELTGICRQKFIFLEVRKIIDENPQLHVGSCYYDLLDHGWVAFGVMGVRRQVKNSKDGSISLARLISEVKVGAPALTFERFQNLYEGTPYPELPRMDFEQFNSQGAGCFNPQIAEEDLLLLSQTSSAVEEFADRRIAHIDSREVYPLPTFDNLHQSIDLLEKLALKYRLLLTAVGGSSLTPTIGYNWKRIFEVPWISREGS